MKQPSAGAAVLLPSPAWLSLFGQMLSAGGESQGQRLHAREHPRSSGCLALVQLPAAVLAAQSPEGLGKHSMGLEKCTSAWALLFSR